MKYFLLSLLFGVTLQFGAWAESLSCTATNSRASRPAVPIPFSQIGAVADKEYSGDGLAVTSSPEGARLRCLFQKLNARVTTEGLWLDSAADRASGQPFRVTATSLGRRQANALSQTGHVRVSGQVVQFIRPGLTEQYSVGVDGLRQDFVIENRPDGIGPVKLELSIVGARATAQGQDVRLSLADSGRQLLYHQLTAEDARGKTVSARFEVVSQTRLAIVLEDASAEYPVRIDPTFSDANWVSLGGVAGVNGEILSEVIDSEGNLYVGGSFLVAGNILAGDIAEWNGSAWSSLGSGISGLDVGVSALAISGTNLYVGGRFASAGGIAASNIAQWNGYAWSSLGAGVSDIVSALAVSGSNLYVGGNFTSAGGSPASHIAVWNGSSWSALGAGVNSSVYALATSGTNLFLGGGFTTAGGVSANYIAQWNGNSWLSLGSGLNGQVDAVAVSGTNVYVGGYFSAAGGAPANNIAQWNGSAWSALGEGVNNGALALLASGTNLYVGGRFTTAGGVTDYGVALWNGSSWSNIGLSGVQFPNNGWVFALASANGTLYAGGKFGPGYGGPFDSIAVWNGTNWSALSPGTDSVIEALAVSGNTLYVGGEFDSVFGVSANSVAEWNGTNWLSLGLGITGYGSQGGPFVDTLAVSGTNLYAGGSFTTAGGLPANNVARWNGISWSTLGAGLPKEVYALALVGTNLYGTSISGDEIDEWNGTNWSPLGSGPNGAVFALAAFGTNLYAGGDFSSAGGVPASKVAEWNGLAWSALGSGVSGEVDALAVSGTNLYAGGTFSMAGGVPANAVAEWNGSSWSALGSGVSGSVLYPWNPNPMFPFGPKVDALAASGSDLYVGGTFSLAGGNPATNIAHWDGTAWSAMGDGMNFNVTSLAFVGNNLFACGDFDIVGTNACGWLAEAVLGPLAPVIDINPVPQYLLAGANAAFNVGADGSPPLAYQWFLNGNAITDATNTVLSVADIGPDQAGDYSVVVTNFYGSVTSSIVPLSIILPPAFSSISLGADGSLRLSVQTIANVPSRIYTASNLSPPVIWLPIYTNLNGGSWQFTDTNPGQAHSKFYRLSAP